MFPEELPKRLIKMYSFIGDTVLDPFLGSGTTAKVALELKRNAIGYEINEDFVELIKKKLGLSESLLFSNVEILKREGNIKRELKEVDYIPSIPDIKPKLDPKKLDFRKGTLYKVVDIVNENTIKLNTGLFVKFLGVEIIDKDRAKKYLRDYLLKKEVIIKVENNSVVDENTILAYVYLKNKIFVNAYLIKSGLAKADSSKDYIMKKKFLELEKGLKNV